jgi:monoterpene epsilon-lactone hydrolase
MHVNRHGRLARPTQEAPDERVFAVLTAVTHALLRRTVRRWFEFEPDIPTMRRKLDRFVTSIDSMQRSYTVTEVGPGLHMIEPARGELPEAAPLILYFHGGGYIVGGLASHGAFCARLAKAAGARVLFADYRLAPEHHFPAAMEDGLAALDAAVALAKGKLILAGDSAGGGLALAVTQAAIAHGQQAPLFPDALVLISPWTDLTLSGPSMASNAATDSMLSAKILTRMRATYLGAQEPADRRASPLFDPNTHLPPVLLIYSTSEVLRDDATRLAANLRLGGTQVTEHKVAGKPHVFPLFKAVPGARRAVQLMGEFVKG